MSLSVIAAAFDPESLQKIQQFANWQPILEDELRKAHDKADSLLQMRAKIIAPYLTGNLDSHFDAKIISPYQSTMFNDAPYAWRREEGFSGMTDKLGRYYPNDPGTHYMSIALYMNKNTIAKIFGTALDAALARLGVMP